eukprot:4711285-Amphidinium_carterae.1
MHRRCAARAAADMCSASAYTAIAQGDVAGATGAGTAMEVTAQGDVAGTASERSNAKVVPHHKIWTESPVEVVSRVNISQISEAHTKATVQT